MPDRTALTATEPAPQAGQPLRPLDLWLRHRPRGPMHAYFERSRFKYKSLSSWAYNIAMGCNHACRFCYVPSTSIVLQRIR